MTSLSDVHVLVVDDNRQMRTLMRALLRAAFITRVTEAETAAQAFEAMAATPVDLLLVDWRMEPVDGLEFTRMVRKQAPNPYVPVLMMTAHTEASRVAAARDAGVSGFVKKPISARILFERMSSALTDPRLFVRTGDFFGPDRRRGGQSPDYQGPLRRSTDHGGAEELDLDDARFRV